VSDEHNAKKGADIDLSTWTNYTPKNIPQQEARTRVLTYVCSLCVSSEWL
jgi:hypothetical protein